jgi:two-component system repressor protein LuxO
VQDIKPLWLVEQEAIAEALEICGQNIPKAAAYLEIGVSTIYRKKAEYQAAKKQSKAG